MPLYEYHCTGCEAEFELLIRGGEAPACPSCGTANVEKLLSVPAAAQMSNERLPVCDAPLPAAGCGLPQCGQGGCQNL